jgi:hypothetical protein
MTVLGIEGFSPTQIVDFCGHVTAPHENAVYLCNKYMGLPDYVEMGQLFDQQRVQGPRQLLAG